MSKYKVGDLVTCEVETRKNGKRYVLAFDKKVDKKNIVEMDFQVILVNNVAGSEYNTYMIVIPEDIIGWTVNRFHVETAGIAKAFLGKKFWELTEQFIIKKVEK